MPKATETVLEINLTSLEHNYNYLRSRIKATTKFLAVVKAFAYGSDAVKIAEKLAHNGVDYLAVAYANEGVEIRNAGIKIPILVLHPVPANFDVLVQYRLEPSIYSRRMLALFTEHLKETETENYPIHLKFNTGLNRLGFLEDELDLVTDVINESKTVKVASVFSHLAASEDHNEKEFTENQIRRFKKVILRIDQQLGYAPIKHLLNTSGLLNYPEAQFDMVRSGIGIYGFGNDEKYNKHLKPIASLKTIISQIHHLEPNESIGYNRGFTASERKTVATLPIGHADGIGRIYGNQKGFVFIKDTKALILGNTCMDMIMVDVTHINCKEGDEVIVFNEIHTADSLATAADTISYELITGISQRVKRRYIEK
ncbi:alanine racemase [Cellulophaga sp. F20128]|uniref:alanine racemase n=1 Tax=Cellulophaga sp. F20128 TaxID=2926413 RepID=UPI001FF6688E|nr:alanine racemase [Cellulophaga sp. F20128]MCK0158774.1 alanine racemase [Cellulophaga sp. F20128]